MKEMLTIEYDGKGNFRIFIRDHTGKPVGRGGDWVFYQSIANIFVNGKMYIAVSDYFEGTSLKPNVIYELTEVQS